jgi:two-component system, OmpR family, aerobic respiration control sensor histidine kinase ArcB
MDNCEYMADIVSNLPGNVYWKDKNGVYLGANIHAAVAAGLSSVEDYIGKTDHDLFSKKQADQFRKNDVMVMQTGLEHSLEETSYLADGTVLIQLSTKRPLLDKKGEVVGILGITVDITDRKRAEKLQIEKEAAEKISRAVEMMSGCIAHELRTPLAIIGINVDNLQMMLKKMFADSEKTERKDQVAKFINNIKFAVNSAGGIISMLLVKLHNLINKQVDSKKFEPNSIKLCINDVINEYPFYNNECQFIVWNDQENEDFIYMGDKLLTKHVIFNLIKNALKAIKESGRGKIHISLQHGEKSNKLIFKDSSIGIPAEIFKSLFHQFNSNSKEGTGLGLAFCKMIMRSYDGDIVCDSQEGKYTEFVLSFPKVRNEAGS